MRLLRSQRCISCLHIDLFRDSASGLIPVHKHVTTYSSASETRIQLENVVSPFRANKGRARTLSMKRQAPRERLIEKFGKPAGYGIDEPWGVAGGIGTNAGLICASVRLV